MAKSHVVKDKLIGNYSAKFGAIFVTSERIVLRLCKIKRLNSNSFVLRFRYLQILFPPRFPGYSSLSLYCVPLLGFMVSAGFKIQSYCLLFSIDKYIAFCNFAFGQIHFSIWTNAFCNLDKYSRLYCRVAKCQFFTQIKIWVQNFTPKTRKLRLVCFCDKSA